MKSNHRQLISEINANRQAKNTSLAYDGDWRRFEQWASSEDYTPLPATPDTVSAYCAVLHQAGRKPSTIRRAVAAIAHRHRGASLSNPCKSDIVKALLVASNRDRPVPTNRARALRLETLVKVYAAIDRFSSTGRRDKALLCALWFCALRRSEAASLRCNDITVDPDNGIIVAIRHSKTDQIGTGAHIAIPFSPYVPLLPPSIYTGFCPATDIGNWAMAVRCSLGKKNENPPLFPRIWERRTLSPSMFTTFIDSPISEKTISRIILKRLSKVTDITGYSSHSMRAGLITELACFGIEDHRIAEISRHQSIEVLRGYIREGQTWTKNPLAIFFEKIACERQKGMVQNSMIGSP